MVEYSSERLDAVYSAIAHPIRRELLGRLAGSPARVTDVASRFTVSLAAVSKHIRVLEAAGLLRRSIDGREHRLALEPAALADATHWLETYRWFWESRIDLLEARLLDPGPR